MADILGAFEQAVLLAIVRLGEDAYGRAVLKEVQVRLDRDVAAGAVHATLDRLENKGLVGSRLGIRYAHPIRSAATFLPLAAAWIPCAQRDPRGGGEPLARPRLAAGRINMTATPPEWAEALLRLVPRPRSCR